MAAQMFNRWSHRGVWERLLELAQQRGGLTSMASVDVHPTLLWLFMMTRCIQTLSRVGTANQQGKRELAGLGKEDSR
jgi:hypothetical protein